MQTSVRISSGNFVRISRQIPEKNAPEKKESVTCVAFSIEFARNNLKIAENSDICENYSIFFIIIHSCPQRRYLLFSAPGRLFLAGVHFDHGRPEHPRIGSK